MGCEEKKKKKVEHRLGSEMLAGFGHMIKTTVKFHIKPDESFGKNSIFERTEKPE